MRISSNFRGHHLIFQNRTRILMRRKRCKIRKPIRRRICVGCDAGSINFFISICNCIFNDEGFIILDLFLIIPVKIASARNGVLFRKLNRRYVLIGDEENGCAIYVIICGDS
jgi:hypothetical protein